MFPPYLSVFIWDCLEGNLQGGSTWHPEFKISPCLLPSGHSHFRSTKLGFSISEWRVASHFDISLRGFIMKCNIIILNLRVFFSNEELNQQNFEWNGSKVLKSESDISFASRKTNFSNTELESSNITFFFRNISGEKCNIWAFWCRIWKLCMFLGAKMIALSDSKNFDVFHSKFC